MINVMNEYLLERKVRVGNVRDGAILVIPESLPNTI